MNPNNIRQELFALTYGSVVRNILKEYEEDEDMANKQMEELGYSMGQKMIEEFLSKENNICKSFKEVGESIIKAFDMFYQISAKLKINGKKEISILFNSNPLDTFLFLSKSNSELLVSNILCGNIRGALSAVNINTKAIFAKDRLQTEFEGKKEEGLYSYEIKVFLIPVSSGIITK